jgi:GNAT superfamily N-acetyltransferase
MNVRPITPEDREWVADLIGTAFGSVRLMSNDHLIEDASLLDGFAAEIDGRPVGCALVNAIDGDTELVALVSTYRGAGVGSGLLESVVERGRRDGWK